MSDITFLLIIVLYYTAAILVTKFIYKSIKEKSWVIKLLLLPFLYSLLFGIGVISSGDGDPGFAIPIPVIFSAIWSDKNMIVKGALNPFLFWWLIALVGMALRMVFQWFFNREWKSQQ